MLMSVAVLSETNSESDQITLIQPPALPCIAQVSQAKALTSDNENQLIHRTHAKEEHTVNPTAKFLSINRTAHSSVHIMHGPPYIKRAAGSRYIAVDAVQCVAQSHNE